MTIDLLLDSSLLRAGAIPFFFGREMCYGLCSTLHTDTEERQQIRVSGDGLLSRKFLLK